MSRKVMSIRGEMVDFDLSEIKKQILNSPENDSAKKRERFIDKKRRRITKTSATDLSVQQQQNEAMVREALNKQKLAQTTAPDVTNPIVTDAPKAKPITKK